jgi:membrane-associated protease RseP (regulator of RpoE activity)
MLDESKSPAQRAAEELEAAVSELFSVHDVTLGTPGQPEAIRLRGRLQIPAHDAYPKIAARLRPMEYTPELSHDPESDLDVLLALPGVLSQESGSRVWLNLVLYVATILSTLFVGTTWSDQVPTDASIGWLVSHLWLGWPYALSLMTILTGHELGHYFAGRYYKVPVSLPFFIPMPLPPLGTMGAFILMKGRSADRRQMLTVGAAGPLAGFILAVPILILGLSLSEVKAITPPPPGMSVFWEGNSLLYLLLKLSVFGQILPGSGAPPTFLAALREIGAALLGNYPIQSGYDVFIHPVALAGWAGLLVTALNLIPVGQLDGGHTLYSLIGQRAKMLTWPVIGILVVMGIFLWQGWMLWALLIFMFGQGHPAPLDTLTRLDTRRKIVAVVVLAIFVLTFTPVPMQLISGEPLVSELDPATGCLALPGLVVGVAFWLARRTRNKSTDQTLK